MPKKNTPKPQTARDIQLVDINKLIPYTFNNRKHPEKQLIALKNSLLEFGFVNPILVDKDFVIIAGHGRYAAALSLEYKQAPCIVLDDLSEAETRRLRLLDNKIAEMSEKDIGNIKTEIDLLAIEGLADDLGDYFSDDLSGIEIETNIDDEGELQDDEVNQEDIKTNIKTGDIIEIGPHRILCGDSTKEEDVKKLMDGKTAQLGFNDPPYGMKKEADGVENDNLNFEDLLEFNKKWIAEQMKILDENGSFYMFGIDEPLMDAYAFIFKPLIKQNKVTFRNLLTWDKGSGQGQNSEDFRMYPIADEKCLFLMLGVQGFNTNSDNYFEKWESIRKYIDDEMQKMKWNTKIVADFFGFHARMADHWRSKSQFSLIKKEQYEVLQEKAEGKAFKREYDDIKREYDDIKREYYETRSYFDNTHDNMNNVWHFGRTAGEEREYTGNHATPKPLELCKRAIKSSSEEGKIVTDFFLGSGSTMVAAEYTRRICYGMELTPKYCQVTIDRMQKLFPTYDVRINGQII